MAQRPAQPTPRQHHPQRATPMRPLRRPYQRVTSAAPPTSWPLRDCNAPQIQRPNRLTATRHLWPGLVNRPAPLSTKTRPPIKPFQQTLQPLINPFVCPMTATALTPAPMPAPSSSPKRSPAKKQALPAQTVRTALPQPPPTQASLTPQRPSRRLWPLTPRLQPRPPVRIHPQAPSCRHRKQHRPSVQRPLQQQR